MDRINNICFYKSIGHPEFISGSYEMAFSLTADKSLACKTNSLRVIILSSLPERTFPEGMPLASPIG